MTISIYCPHCHMHTSLVPAPVEYKCNFNIERVGAIWRQDYNSFWWIGVCNYCGKPVLVHGDGDTVYPQPLPQPTNGDVPEQIRRDLDEAKMCFAVSAWRAVAVMARRAMQSAAIEKGATQDKLRDQIANLATQGKITTDLKELADVVRWVGNDAAHPSGQEVTSEDADDVLRLAEQFLHVLYVTPAIAKKLREKKGK